jgi:hypothetical protein
MDSLRRIVIVGADDSHADGEISRISSITICVTPAERDAVAKVESRQGRGNGPIVTQNVTQASKKPADIA